jgi:hypothetical protein
MVGIYNLEVNFDPEWVREVCAGTDLAGREWIRVERPVELYLARWYCAVRSNRRRNNVLPRLSNADLNPRLPVVRLPPPEMFSTPAPDSAPSSALCAAVPLSGYSGRGAGHAMRALELAA